MELQWPLILFTFFVCFASGTLLTQGVLTFLGKGKATQLPALIASLALLVIGGISVFLHLEHWERIFNGFGHITSGITLEFIGCVVFFVVLVVFFLMMRRSEDGMAPKWCGVLAVIVGIAMPVVTGDSYLMAAIPAWNTPLLPLYYAVNAVLMGMLGMLVLGTVVESKLAVAEADEEGAAAVSFDGRDLCSKVALIATLVQAVIVIVYAVYIMLSSGSFSDVVYYFDPTMPDVSMVDIDSEMSSILAGSLAPAFYIGVILVGVVGTLAALLLAARKKAQGTQLVAYSGVALVCTLAGGLVWRCLLYVVAMSVFALY